VRAVPAGRALAAAGDGVARGVVATRARQRAVGSVAAARARLGTPLARPADRAPTPPGRRVARRAALARARLGAVRAELAARTRCRSVDTVARCTTAQHTVKKVNVADIRLPSVCVGFRS